LELYIKVETIDIRKYYKYFALIPLRFEN